MEEFEFKNDDDSENVTLGETENSYEEELETETDEDGRPVYAQQKAKAVDIKIEVASGNIPTIIETHKEAITTGSNEHVLNLKKVFDNAIAVFTDKDVSLPDLALQSAKTHSFLDSISGVTAASHEFEVLSGDKDKFKRVDELYLLNALREQCGEQVETNGELGKVIQTKLQEMRENSTEFTPEEIANFMLVVDTHRKGTTEMITNVDKLIRLERSSGGREWGPRKSINPNIGYLSGVDAMSRGLEMGANGRIGPGGAGGRPIKPRKLSEKDLNDIKG